MSTVCIGSLEIRLQYSASHHDSRVRGSSTLHSYDSECPQCCQDPSRCIIHSLLLTSKVRSTNFVPHGVPYNFDHYIAKLISGRTVTCWKNSRCLVRSFPAPLCSPRTRQTWISQTYFERGCALGNPNSFLHASSRSHQDSVACTPKLIHTCSLESYAAYFPPVVLELEVSS